MLTVQMFDSNGDGDEYNRGHMPAAFSCPTNRSSQPISEVFHITHNSTHSFVYPIDQTGKPLSHFPFIQPAKMVSFTKIAFAILAAAGLAAACDFCQCQYADGSHCCADKAADGDCDNACSVYKYCGSNGASNCISYSSYENRNQCNSFYMNPKRLVHSSEPLPKEV